MEDAVLQSFLSKQQAAFRVYAENSDAYGKQSSLYETGSERREYSVQSDITEQALQELGFIKTPLRPGATARAVYVYEFGQSGLSLTTNESLDEIAKGADWSVSFFDHEQLTFTSIKQIKRIIYSIENRKINE